jgi:predicted nucleic acid-binding protein
MIACDTSSLSQFFRRQKTRDNGVASSVEKLINSNRIALFGIVRQELLAGIKQLEQFHQIEISIRALPLHFAGDEDHVTAANFSTPAEPKGFRVLRSIF